MSVTSEIRVILVDDLEIIRRVLRASLEIFDDLAVIGEAANGAEALELCKELEPDIVLMDLDMPIMDGISATEVLSQRGPGPQVIGLTHTSDVILIHNMLQAGARACLTKTEPLERIVQTIRHAHKQAQIACASQGESSLSSGSPDPAGTA